MQERASRILERLPLATDRPVVAYAVTLCFVLVSLGLRLAAEGVLPGDYPFITFFPAVILATFLFGVVPGAFAALLCGALSIVFILPSTHGTYLSWGLVTALTFYTLVVVTDIAIIHFMQRATRHLREERERCTALAEKSDLLFRELQHRVSNNLQVVAALLALQKRHISDDQARQAIDDASRRLGLIGRIHRQLYDPNGARLGMAAFLEQLSSDLVDAAGRPGIACSVDADDSVMIDADAAIPVALIVAEAVSNALEHGFADRDTGNIGLCLRRQDARHIVLTVTDDGRGPPDGFALESSTSLGLRIATTLARQLGGSFELVHGSGAVARLTLPG